MLVETLYTRYDQGFSFSVKSLAIPLISPEFLQVYNLVDRYPSPDEIVLPQT